MSRAPTAEVAVHSVVTWQAYGVWLVLGLAGVAVVASGWLPGDVAGEVALGRAGPVLGFLVAVTVLAELADHAGVFDAAATGCARVGRGSILGLFGLVALLGTLTTIMMSLDTTAVLLTPVVLSLAGRLGIAREPFALLVVWLANTASLLLPVSNLTNLLALQREQISTLTFAARMALPELVAVVVTTGYLALLFRRELSGRYLLPDRTTPDDRVVFRICACCCISLAPGVLLGFAPWAVATGAAAVAVAVHAWRRTGALRVGLLPWRLVIFTEGLFLTVTALARHGLTDLLAAATGRSLLASAAVSAVAANLLNNLPAYLAIEPAVPAGHTIELLAVLLGTNAGPLILPWASLATLLWRDRCRARGLRVHPARFAIIGVIGVPLVVLTTVAALHV